MSWHTRTISLYMQKTKKSLENHFNAVKSRLISKGVTVNSAKTVKSVQEIKFLGRIISTDDIKPNKEHVRKALDLKRPESRKEIQSLMGFFNFFRDFLPKFSQKALFLIRLTGKPINFKVSR